MSSVGSRASGFVFAKGKLYTAVHWQQPAGLKRRWPGRGQAGAGVPGDGLLGVSGSRGWLTCHWAPGGLLTAGCRRPHSITAGRPAALGLALGWIGSLCASTLTPCSPSRRQAGSLHPPWSAGAAGTPSSRRAPTVGTTGARLRLGGPDPPGALVSLVNFGAIEKVWGPPF